MQVLTAAEQAAALLREHGAPGAWQRATQEALRAHLSHAIQLREHWRAIQAELLKVAPRPGPSELDIYRTARLLIAEHGAKEAWRMAMAKAATQDRVLYQQAISLRVADAIKALSPGGPEEKRVAF